MLYQIKKNLIFQHFFAISPFHKMTQHPIKHNIKKRGKLLVSQIESKQLTHLLRNLLTKSRVVIAPHCILSLLILVNSFIFTWVKGRKREDEGWSNKGCFPESTIWPNITFDVTLKLIFFWIIHHSLWLIAYHKKSCQLSIMDRQKSNKHCSYSTWLLANCQVL